MIVSELLVLAEAAKKSVETGRMRASDSVYVSLETCKDSDESHVQ